MAVTAARPPSRPPPASALNIPAQGGTDITFELDITALDDASESIPIVVTFLTASDAVIDVTTESIVA